MFLPKESSNSYNGIRLHNVVCTFSPLAPLQYLFLWSNWKSSRFRLLVPSLWGKDQAIWYLTPDNCARKKLTRSDKIWDLWVWLKILLLEIRSLNPGPWSSVLQAIRLLTEGFRRFEEEGIRTSCASLCSFELRNSHLDLYWFWSILVLESYAYAFWDYEQFCMNKWVPAKL